MSAFRMVAGMVLAATISLAAASPVLAGLHQRAFDPASLTCALDDLEAEIEVVDRLRVNLQQSSRMVAPNKCQHEGERELLDLAASAASEEAYAFVPSLCTWIETGYHETDRSVRVDRPLIDRLVQCYRGVSLYHIHPGPHQDAAWHFPAFTDMLIVVLINGKFLDDPLVSVSHHAVTARGTFGYSFVISEAAKSLIEAMKATGLGDLVSENLAYEYARDRHRTKYYEAVRECSQRLKSSEDDPSACFPMRAGDFMLEFSELYP